MTHRILGHFNEDSGHLNGLTGFLVWSNMITLVFPPLVLPPPILLGCNKIYVYIKVKKGGLSIIRIKVVRTGG